MGTLIIVGQLILSLSILVTLHECGHFFPAKWFKTKVEKFYLFFDPWFSLFKIKKGDTEYGIGWLPLGGYVKIAGMIDESFDKKHLEEEPQEWEFRSKPAWQRLIIMLGGVTVNFILGILIFAGIYFTWGDSYLPASEAKYGIHVDSLGYEIGLRDGDKVLSIGDKPFDKFNPNRFKLEIIIENPQSYKVLRDGKEIDIPIDPSYSSVLSTQANKEFSLFSYRYPYQLAEVDEKSPAYTSGLRTEDKILSINGSPIAYVDQVTKITGNNKNKNVDLEVLKPSGDTTMISTPVDGDGRMGVLVDAAATFFKMENEKYGILESIPKGVEVSWDFLSGQLKAFGKMFNGGIKPSESLGSVISIAKEFGPTWDWERFWRMTASLSILLAFLNLLPIPGLDGGHVVFLLYEVVSGRKPSDKVVEYSTIVGFILLVVLMIFALGLDISRLF